MRKDWYKRRDDWIDIVYDDEGNEKEVWNSHLIIGCYLNGVKLTGVNGPNNMAYEIFLDPEELESFISALKDAKKVVFED